PAEAANKAGARCTKEGSTTRIGGDRYVCTTNPRYPNERRTWVWVGCIQANTLYTDSVKRLDGLKAGLVTAKAKLDELTAEIPAAEAKAKEYDAKIVTTQVKLDAAKANYEENRVKGTAYAKATEQWNNAVKSYERAIAGFKRAADNWREKSSDVAAQQKRLDLQSQTIAASEVEIKSNLKGRNQACQKGL
ncbi:MAG: hypothetical protein ACKN96_03285, partial [Actinomycetota bacterium]